MKYIGTLVVLLMVGVVGCNGQGNDRKLTLPDTRLRPDTSGDILTVSDSADRLVGKLGSPTKSLKYAAKDPAWSVWNYSWTGLKIETFAGNKAIKRIETDDPSFSTKRGVRVGDDLAKVERLYGKPDIKTERVLGYALPTEDFVWTMDFFFGNGKLTRIVVTSED